MLATKAPTIEGVVAVWYFTNSFFHSLILLWVLHYETVVVPSEPAVMPNKVAELYCTKLPPDPNVRVNEVMASVLLHKPALIVVQAKVPSHSVTESLE